MHGVLPIFGSFFGYIMVYIYMCVCWYIVTYSIYVWGLISCCPKLAWGHFNFAMRSDPKTHLNSDGWFIMIFPDKSIVHTCLAVTGEYVNNREHLVPDYLELFKHTQPQESCGLYPISSLPLVYKFLLKWQFGVCPIFAHFDTNDQSLAFLTHRNSRQVKMALDSISVVKPSQGLGDPSY